MYESTRDKYEWTRSVYMRITLFLGYLCILLSDNPIKGLLFKISVFVNLLITTIKQVFRSVIYDKAITVALVKEKSINIIINLFIS